MTHNTQHLFLVKFFIFYTSVKRFCVTRMRDFIDTNGNIWYLGRFEPLSFQISNCSILCLWPGEGAKCGDPLLPGRPSGRAVRGHRASTGQTAARECPHSVLAFVENSPQIRDKHNGGSQYLYICRLCYPESKASFAEVC